MDLTKKLAAARAKRDALVKDAGAIIAAADAETRDLTAEEETRWNDLHEQVKRAGAEAAMLEKQLEAERAAASVVITRDNPHVEQRVRYKTLRGFTKEDDAYRAGMWARNYLFNDPVARGWCNDHGVEVRVAGEGIFTKGGALVPMELSQAIIDLRETYGLARRPS